MILAVPDLRQNADHDCGRAVAEAACLAIGAKFDPQKFVADPLDGIDPAAMEIQLRGLGLNVFAGNGTVDVLKAFIALRMPVLTPIQVDNAGHWVLVKGVVRGRVHVMDPLPGGRSVYNAAGFTQVWSDVTRRGWKVERWGIAVGSKQ